MTDFVVDKGLDVLLVQINAKAPGRDKSSDGSIGDAAHQARDSDHNPESPPPPGNPDHQVDARDFTHDPAHGADMGEITEAIRISRDPRVAYVIFNRRIFSNHAVGSYKAYEWRPYDGADPHTGHAHVSVNDTYHDQTYPWSIEMSDFTADDRNKLNNVYAGMFFGGPSCGKTVTVDYGGTIGKKTGNSLFLKLDYLATLLEAVHAGDGDLDFTHAEVIADVEEGVRNVLKHGVDDNPA